MPIRFRCAYCNQLLGIARRKAGQVVRCPTCAGQVVVPTTEEAEAAKEPPSPPQNPPLFEQSDFDNLLQPPRPGPAVLPPPAPIPAPLPPPAPAPAAAWQPPAVQFDVEQAPPGEVFSPPATQRPAGIVLTPARATFLTVMAIIAVAVAFGAGVLVGRFAL